MLEKYLIEHCAPTLAALTTANLFTYRFGSEKALREQIRVWNEQLCGKGIQLFLLRRQANTALIYVCRKQKLQADLLQPGVALFLRQYGYQTTDADTALHILTDRLENCADFPHEIGIFLGYPLADVMGFIRNAGQNAKCTGCWKVYCNECEAIRVFAKLKKCKAVYMRLYKEGKTVLQLTGAA